MKDQLVFGEISKAEAEKKFGIANPAIVLHGLDKFGRTCKTCSHLCPKRMSKTHWKCDLGKETAGLGSDHRVNWPACGRYERKT